MDRTRLLEACEIEFHTREGNMKPIRRWLAGQAFAPESLLDPFRLMEAVVALRALHALGRTSQMLKAFPESTAAAVPVTVNLLAHLSRQEQRVCQHMLEGKSNGIIAQSLGISLETVKKHCQHIYRKLGVHGRQALIDKLA